MLGCQVSVGGKLLTVKDNNNNNEYISNPWEHFWKHNREREHNTTTNIIKPFKAYSGLAEHINVMGWFLVTKGKFHN